MTSTSITLHVPQQSRDEWAALDDPGLTRQQRAASASTALHSTPPIALAKRARHRKPNRRRSVIRTALGTLALVAAIFGMASGARHVPTAPAYYGLTPGQVSQVATTLEAPGYQLTADVTPHITVWAGMLRGVRPAITVTIPHVPACVTDPTVVAVDSHGAYWFWGDPNGSIQRGRFVSMTQELKPANRGVWHIVAVNGEPCGNPDGEYSWPVGVTVKVQP